MRPKRPTAYHVSEAKTGDGSLIHFSFAGDNFDEIRKTISGLYDVEIPRSHKIVGHGSLGRYSRYRIKQHKYAGGNDESGGGYIEVLEIRDAPDGRCNVVIHEYRYSGGRVYSSFTEWKSVAHAVAFWGKCWSSHDPMQNAKKAKGFVRLVDCGLLSPWFYAVGNQDLIGDYAFPDDMQDDPVFRFGAKCLVPSKNFFEDEQLEVKTCLGCRVFVEEADRSGESARRSDRLVRIVFFDDGTSFDSWDESSSTPSPRPLFANELWTHEAMMKFQELLSGKCTKFQINFANGGMFVGKFVSPGPVKHDPEGDYYAEVTFKVGGPAVKGRLDFTPTSECPTVVSQIMKKLKTGGKEIAKIKVTMRSKKVGGKRWSGVFFTK